MKAIELLISFPLLSMGYAIYREVKVWDINIEITPPSSQPTALVDQLMHHKIGLRWCRSAPPPLRVW